MVNQILKFLLIVLNYSKIAQRRFIILYFPLILQIGLKIFTKNNYNIAINLIFGYTDSYLLITRI